MEFEFAEPASIELDDAIKYYNIQAEVLCDIFSNEVLNTISLIRQFPKGFSQNTIHTKKAIAKKFPYSLIYTLRLNKIYILAVAHQH